MLASEQDPSTPHSLSEVIIEANRLVTAEPATKQVVSDDGLS
jgi:hypothetical protein